jgi:hypothetical protein
MEEKVKGRTGRKRRTRRSVARRATPGARREAARRAYAKAATTAAETTAMPARSDAMPQPRSRCNCDVKKLQQEGLRKGKR